MKISAKHTPGPWKAHIDNCQTANVELSDGHCIYIGGEEQDIDTIDANTYLIAAAPELLEAAKLAVKLCKLVTRWANAEQPVSYFIMDKIVYLAQDNNQPAKAVAKAEGR